MWSKQLSVILLILACLLAVEGRGQVDDRQERILARFHPYRQGPLQVEGIKSGMKINATNSQVAEALLPPEILQYLRAGDFTITVQETTDTPLREAYIQTTLASFAQVELGEGELKNYVAGLPFPLIDPHAGEKVAWNHRYRDRGENVQYWPPNELRNSRGTVERADRFYAAYVYGMHRPQAVWNLPPWEDNGIYSKHYTRTLAPTRTPGCTTRS